MSTPLYGKNRPKDWPKDSAPWVGDGRGPIFMRWLEMHEVYTKTLNGQIGVLNPIYDQINRRMGEEVAEQLSKT